MRQLKTYINKDVLKRMRHNAPVIEIKNFKYDDLLISGNVVRIDHGDGIGNDHLVFSVKDGVPKGIKIIDPKVKSIMVGVRIDGKVYYYTPDFYERLFPRNELGSSPIIKVFSSRIDVSKIKDEEDVIEVFKKYRLRRVGEKIS